MQIFKSIIEARRVQDSFHFPLSGNAAGGNGKRGNPQLREPYVDVCSYTYIYVYVCALHSTIKSSCSRNVCIKLHFAQRLWHVVANSQPQLPHPHFPRGFPPRDGDLGRLHMCRRRQRNVYLCIV